MTCGCKACFARARGFEVPRGRSFAGDFTCRQLETCVDPNLLLDLDFSTPSVQPFPASAGEMTALGITAPTALWTCQEASPGNLIDQIGSVDLTYLGAASGRLQGQLAGGIWSGSSLYGRSCIETPQATNAHWAAANGGLLDVGAGDFTCAAFMRLKHNSSSRSLFSKYDGVTNDGWILMMTGQTLRWYAGDTDGTAGGVNGPSIADQAWHLVFLVRDGDDWKFYTDVGNSTFNYPAMDNITNTALFSIGMRADAWGGGGSAFQCAWAAFWVGTALVQADHDALWNHATDPTGLLTTASHASALSDVVGDDPVTGLVLSDYAVDDVVIGYNAALSNARKLGLRCSPAISTLLSESDDFASATWTKTNVAVNTTQTTWGNSPRGCLSCAPITASAINGYLEHLYTTVAATQYTQSVFLRRNGAADVTGRLIMYDATGGAEVASLVFTATALWQRFDLTAITNAGQISTGFRIEIDTSGESLFAFRASACLGPWAPPIYANAGIATQALTDYQVVSAAGLYLHGGQGEITVEAVKDVAGLVIGAGVSQFLMMASVGAALNDARYLYVFPSSPTTYRVGLYTGAGGFLALVTNTLSLDWSLEQLYRLQWDAVTPLPLVTPNYAANLLGANATGGVAAPWVATNQTTHIHIGQNQTAAQQWQGLISRCRIWAGPRCS